MIIKGNICAGSGYRYQTKRAFHFWIVMFQFGKYLFPEKVEKVVSY